MREVRDLAFAQGLEQPCVSILDLIQLICGCEVVLSAKLRGKEGCFITMKTVKSENVLHSWFRVSVLLLGAI